MDIREKMRRDWDRRARVDARYWVAATEEADEDSYLDSAERDVAALLEGLSEPLDRSASVLDLGCGIGRLTAPLAGRFREVVGVDVSPAMIEAARALHADLPDVHFETNSGADLADFEDERFDLVFSYSVLPHLPEDVLVAYFHEVSRVLKPGGWFRYQFWVGEPRERAAHADNDSLSIRAYDQSRFEALNRDAGLEVVEVTPIDYFDPILELHPVWVNARRVNAPEGRAPALAERPAELSAGEQTMEYGLLLYLAIKHAERGESDRAEAVLEQAVAIAPDRPEAYVQWATACAERDDYAGAGKLFEALTERCPTLPIGWLYRAQIEAGQERFDAARASLDRFFAFSDVDEELLEPAQDLRELLSKV